MQKNNAIQEINDELASFLNRELQNIQQKRQEKVEISMKLKNSTIPEDEQQKLQQLHSQLSSILEEKLENLTQVIDTFDALGRQILDVELETRKSESLCNTIKEELDSKTSKMTLFQEKLESQTKENQSLQENIDLLRAELSLEQEGIDRYKETAHKLQETLVLLEKESKDLRTENAKLQSKLKHLEDNIEGMKRLKEEHMLSIMHRTEQLQKISSGTE
ncbi:MAG: hypothetical protein VX278_10535 [Myxococcota bacterium]|nr:hypothetical protein [Myxococcota bacterium]